MNRSRLLFLLISGVFVLTILSGTLLGAPTREGEEGDDSLYKYLSVFTEVLRLVRQAYVDETDLDHLMNGALDGTPDALDPFSMYVPEEGVSDFLAAQKLGETRSGLRIAKERGVAYVIAVQEKGPAATLGLQQGDILSRLNGESTREIPLWQLDKALTQAPGTEVKLQVLRAGETRDFTLKLAEFEPPIAYVETYQDVPRLRIASFTKDTATVVGKLLESTPGDGLLIDVRGAAFGDIEHAYGVAKLFAGGDLGFLVKRDEKLETFTGAAAKSWQGKAVVLVDRGTQGAAEVFAQILRQSSGAKLVGQPTFGFAGRSKVIDLDAGGSIVLTDAFFTGPDGEPVDEGIEPDVLVGDRPRSFKELGEKLDDLILERALDVLHEQPEATEKKAA